MIRIYVESDSDLTKCLYKVNFKTFWMQRKSCRWWWYIDNEMNVGGCQSMLPSELTTKLVSWIKSAILHGFRSLYLGRRITTQSLPPGDAMCQTEVGLPPFWPHPSGFFKRLFRLVLSPFCSVDWDHTHSMIRFSDVPDTYVPHIVESAALALAPSLPSKVQHTPGSIRRNKSRLFIMETPGSSETASKQ